MISEGSCILSNRGSISQSFKVAITTHLAQSGPKPRDIKLRCHRLLVYGKPIGAVQSSLFAPLVANDIDTINACTQSNPESS